jgi:hypothetical protein
MNTQVNNLRKETNIHHDRLHMPKMLWNVTLENVFENGAGSSPSYLRIKIGGCPIIICEQQTHNGAHQSFE